MPDARLHGVLAACGGFLLAVLWMDLMFDVQGLGHPGDPLPPAVLDSIAGYYRRVTTDADPMRHLVGLVMATALLGAAIDLARGGAPRGLRIASALLVAPPVALAVAHILPSAMALGSRTGSPAEQSALARSICAAHLYCFGSIAAFVTLQVAALRRARPRGGA